MELRENTQQKNNYINDLADEAFFRGAMAVGAVGSVALSPVFAGLTAMDSVKHSYRKMTGQLEPEHSYQRRVSFPKAMYNYAEAVAGFAKLAITGNN